jgi:hypothetical protein
VVLANQAISAAAVREFGFRQYFQSQDADRPGEHFYYPIPTGQPLYQDFLAMNELDGARGQAEKTMRFADVDTVYYVVTNYWWQAQGKIVNAKREADTWWALDDQVWVFKYAN